MAAHSRAYVSLDELLGLRHRAKDFSFLPRQPVHSLQAPGRHRDGVARGWWLVP